MKKLLAMLSAFVMLFSLCACHNIDSQPTDPSNFSQPTTEGTEMSTEGTTETTQVPTDAPTAAPTDKPTTPPTQASTEAPTTPTTTQPTICSHNWIDATCTNPKICSKCGATSGSTAGHTYVDATCTAPKTCSKCGATSGSTAGHTYVDATCTTPKTCSKCGATSGSTAGHTYVDATCTAPKTCSKCGATSGSVAGHTYVDATCTTPKTCSICKTTVGNPLDHNWENATCTTPKTCSRCKVTEGTPTHLYKDGKCSNCGKEDMINPQIYFEPAKYKSIEESGDELTFYTLTWDGITFYINASLYLKYDAEKHPYVQDTQIIEYNGEKYFLAGGGGPRLTCKLTDTYIEIYDPEDNLSAKYILQHDGSLRLHVGFDSNVSFFPSLFTKESIRNYTS